MKTVTSTVGKLLADPAGPRVAVIDVPGWDTHANQGTAAGRLAPVLAGLADGLVGLQQAMAPVWNKTIVLTLTEFGRTAHPNGTGGTDHGTASAAFVMGGAVNGGRVIADWPGLSNAQSLPIPRPRPDRRHARDLQGHPARPSRPAAGRHRPRRVSRQRRRAAP